MLSRAALIFWVMVSTLPAHEVAALTDTTLMISNNPPAADSRGGKAVEAAFVTLRTVVSPSITSSAASLPAISDDSTRKGTVLCLAKLTKEMTRLRRA